MKLKTIALLVASLAASTTAFAGVTPAQIENARIAGTLDQVFITGASAPTKSIYEGFVGSGTSVGCDPTTQSIFTKQVGTNATPGGLDNVLGYACTRGTRTIAVYHTVSGGSLTAYTPHTKNALIERLRFLGNPCTLGPFSYVDSSNTNNNATVYKGCTGLTGAQGVSEVAGNPGKPAGGFSDVEAALFTQTIGGGDVTSFGTESDAFLGQAFGLVVSSNLYRALQTKQGVTAAQITADTAFDPLIAPNITKSQYTSIAASSIGSVYQTDWSAILGTTGVGKKVVLHRRVDTSGTQAASNAFFLAAPCAEGKAANLNPASITDNSPGVFEVTENSGTSDVKKGITAAGLAGFFAIGVVSAENDWRLDPTDRNGYRFVKIDGVHPEALDVSNARNTAVNGSYAFHMELKTFVAKTANAFSAALINQIAANLNNPQTAACAVLPRGLTLNPNNPAYGTNSPVGSRCVIGDIGQVAKGTNDGNNCKPQVLVF